MSSHLAPSDPALAFRTTAVSQLKAEHLWDQAADTLNAEDKQLIDFQRSDKLAVLEEVRVVAEKLKVQSLKSCWKIRRKHGEAIIVRDIFAKIVTWVHKFKEIGDQAVQYDPVHAALPWAGVRMLLKIAVSDSQLFEAMVEGLEHITSLITRYAIVEDIYFRGSSKATDQLLRSLLKLYAHILIFMAKARRYFAQNTAKRMARSAIKVKDNTFEELTSNISNCEREVERDCRLIDSERHTDVFNDLNVTRLGLHDLSQKISDFGARVSHGNLDQKQRTERLLQIALDLNDPLTRMEDDMKKVADDLDERQRLRILEWLSFVPFSQHHMNVRADRMHSSGLWLLEKRDFRHWRSSSFSSILWLHGIPGSGKSKLVSLVIDELLHEASNVKIPAPIVYFYCARDSAEPQRAEPDEILRSIARQLSSKAVDEPIRYPTKRRYDQLQKRSSQVPRLGMDDCLSLIVSLLDEIPATIVLDAIDEVDAYRRHRLLDALDVIIQQSSNLVKIFVSSRDDGDIVCRLENSPNLYIQAHDNAEDINRFIHLEVDAAISGKGLLYGQVSQSLKTQIVGTLEKGAEGMFRWVSLQLQNLCDPRRMKIEADVASELGRLPRSLADLYAKIYDQILDSAQHSRAIAERVFQWLLIAQRPLSPEELVAAVSVGEDDMIISVTTRDLLNVTCGLVVVDEFACAIRFAHLSVREFLESRNEYDIVATHRFAVYRCLRVYARASAKRRNGPDTRIIPRIGFEDRTVLHHEKFRNYARLYWPAHITHGGFGTIKPPLKSLLHDFLFQDQSTSFRFIQWRSDVASIPYSLPADLSYGIASATTPFNTICIFNLAPLLDSIDNFQVALSNQKLRGYELKYLENWSPMTPTYFGMNGFHIALDRGHKETVSSLLQKGVNVRECTDRGETPVQIVTRRGHIDLISPLIRSGSDPNALSFMTSLTHWGGLSGLRSSLGFRNSDGRVISALDEDAESPLHYAAFHGQQACVAELLRNGANANIRTTLGATALHRATEGGRFEVLEWLLKAGANPNSAMQHGRTVLHQAAAMGREYIAELLLKYGADPNIRDAMGATPLETAKRYNCESTATIIAEAIGSAPDDESASQKSDALPSSPDEGEKADTGGAQNFLTGFV